MLRTRSGASALFLCAALMASTVSVTTSNAHEAHAAARPDRAHLTPPKTTMAQGVPFDLSGRVSTLRVRRIVRLERDLGHGQWQPVRITRTDRDGQFTFTNVRLSSSTRLRGRLPSLVTRVPQAKGATSAPRTLPEIISPPIAIELTDERGRLEAMPAVNQQGPAPEAPRNDSVVSAWFDPPAPGRRVVLERRNQRGRWVRQAARREDAAGFAVFNVPFNKTYRATARPFDGAGVVATNKARTSKKALIFEDTFDGLSLAPQWQDHVVGRGLPGSQRTCAQTHASQHSVGEGVVSLGIGYDPTLVGQTCSYQAAEGTASSPYLYQTQISTLRSFRFTHGIAAARIKFARASGRHSAFWVQVDGKIPGDPSQGSEIDVVEFFGDNAGTTDRIGSFIHYVAADGSAVGHGQFWQAMADMKPSGDTWWDSFHVFSVVWTPNEYVFRVDGHEFYREDRGISATPQWLNLSATSSDYELADVTPENIDEETQVDWVRVWSL